MDNIDLWVGGLAEDHVAGGQRRADCSRAIIADQFDRLRDGDRFWYQERSSPATELADDRVHARSPTSSAATPTITNLQDNVFFAPAESPTK